MGKRYLVGAMSSHLSLVYFTRFKWRGLSTMGKIVYAPVHLFSNEIFRVFLVTVHDPICTDSGNLNAALYGSFLPIPSESEFPIVDASEYERERLPGAIIAKKERIVINKGRNRLKLKITNTGDRPIQVCNCTSALSLHTLTIFFVGGQIGSHYHFIETNPALSFDRGLAYGRRLDIPAGTAVRFEPGDTKTVTLCSIAGKRIISGGNSLASGVVDILRTKHIVD